MAARAFLDAVVARDIFGLSRDELANILDSFDVLGRRDVKTYGTYRTRDMVLTAFDAVAPVAPATASAPTEAIMPPMYPAGPADEAVIGFMLQLLASRPSMTSAELLDALILATHHDICRAGLPSDADRKTLDRGKKAVPKALYRSGKQPIGWMAARGYLESIGAIEVTDRARTGTVRVGAGFDQALARVGTRMDELVALVLRASEALAAAERAPATTDFTLSGVFQLISGLRQMEAALAA